MRIIESHAFALRSTSAAILMVLALWANPVRAQLAVSDSPVEANTTVIAGTLSGISNQQLPAIIAQDTITAQSLTTPGGAGRFQSQLSYLNSLMQTMGSGIANAQIFAASDGGADHQPDAHHLCRRNFSRAGAGRQLQRRGRALPGPRSVQRGQRERAPGDSVRQ